MVVLSKGKNASATTSTTTTTDRRSGEDGHPTINRVLKQKRQLKGEEQELIKKLRHIRRQQMSLEGEINQLQSGEGTRKEQRTSNSKTRNKARPIPPRRRGGSEVYMNTKYKVGTLVQLSEDRVGTVKFVGRTKFGQGIWYGLKLSEPLGKHDGQVGDVRYFKCQRNHGVFVRVHNILGKLPSKRIGSSYKTIKPRAAPDIAEKGYEIDRRDGGNEDQWGRKNLDYENLADQDLEDGLLHFNIQYTPDDLHNRLARTDLKHRLKMAVHEQDRTLFKNMLGDLGVGTDETWGRASSRMMQDRRYKAIPTVTERKRLFQEYKREQGKADGGSVDWSKRGSVKIDWKKRTWNYNQGDKMTHREASTTANTRGTPRQHHAPKKRLPTLDDLERKATRVGRKMAAVEKNLQQLDEAEQFPGISSWSHADVSKWARRVLPSRLASRLDNQKHLDGHLLLKLNKRRLTEMGFSVKSHRIKIVKAMKQLKANHSKETSPSTSDRMAKSISTHITSLPNYQSMTPHDIEMELQTFLSQQAHGNRGAEVQTIRTDLEENRKQLRGLREQLASRDDEIAERSKELESKEKRVAETQKQLLMKETQITNRLERTQKQLIEKERQLSQKLARTRRELMEKEKQLLTTLAEKERKLSQKIARTKRELAAKEQIIANKLRKTQQELFERERELKKKDNVIQDKDRLLAEQGGRLNKTKTRLEHREHQLGYIDETLVKREQRLLEQYQKIVTQLAQKEQELEDKTGEMKQKDSQFTVLEHALSEQRSQLDERDNSLSLRDREIALQERELALQRQELADKLTQLQVLRNGEPVAGSTNHSRPAGGVDKTALIQRATDRARELLDSLTNAEVPESAALKKRPPGSGDLPVMFFDDSHQPAGRRRSLDDRQLEGSAHAATSSSTTSSKQDFTITRRSSPTKPSGGKLLISRNRSPTKGSSPTNVTISRKKREQQVDNNVTITRRGKERLI